MATFAIKPSVLFKCCFLFIFLACGLEEYYDLPDPTNATRINTPSSSSLTGVVATSESHKFSFSVFKPTATGFINSGTDVYYRIYNNLDQLKNDAKGIDDAIAAQSTNVVSLLQSKSYLRLRSYPDRLPLISSASLVAGSNSVVIRLSDEGVGSSLFSAGISVNTANTGSPLRDDRREFFFDYNTSNSLLPKASDSDTVFSSIDDGYWFVNAYAVSTALTLKFVPVQSKTLGLGFLAFKNRN